MSCSHFRPRLTTLAVEIVCSAEGLTQQPSSLTMALVREPLCGKEPLLWENGGHDA